MSGIRTAALAIAAALVSACASAGGGGAAGGGGLARPSEDRVLLTASGEITGVAVSQRMVFATTPTALLALDRQFDRWLPPYALAQGLRGGMVTAMAADPVEDGAWVGSFGAVTYIRPLLDFGTSAVVPGTPDVIMFDARDPGAGALVRSSGIWSLVSRTGMTSPVDPARLPPPAARILPPTLRELYREYPSLESFGAMLTRDEQLQSWPVTAGARAPDRNEVWLGTAGNGLYRVDPLFNRSEHYPFGLMDPGAGALAPAADGVWIAGLGLDRWGRGGLTFASSDLRRWRWVEGSMTRPLAGARAFALDVRGSVAWVATDRGLVRLDTRRESDSRVFTLADGLPDDRVLAVAATGAGAWVGTARGLAFVRDSLARGERPASGAIAQGTAVRTLLATGDTLWAGTDAGLLLVAPGDSLARRPAALAREPRLGRPVLALARSDSEVVVATDAELVRLAYPSGRLLPRYAALSLASVGAVRAMAMDARTIWIVGAGGVLVVGRADGVTRFHAAPGEIPAEAYDVLLEPEAAWIATRVGVLRMRRLRDGFAR
ncbi:MAG TPA: hypothetical protein VFS05_04055 [Gemmatimonadaceae bacterium]|nr:hypothetical protein [Gemmatimonadaceae bacterium]